MPTKRSKDEMGGVDYRTDQGSWEDMIYSVFDPPVTAVAAATYTIQPTDTLLQVTYTGTGTCAITLQSVQCVNGRSIKIKDAGGTGDPHIGANTYNTTVSTEGAETINGSATAVIATNYGDLTVYSDGTN